MRTLDSYTELSPSGTGLHTIVRARLNGGRRRDKQDALGRTASRTTTARDSSAITGRHLRDTPRAVNERQTQLEQVRAAIWPAKAKPAVAGSILAGADDRELLERAYRAKNGSELDPLRRPALLRLASEADLALCNLLAFWFGPDPARIDRAFRGSGLMRAKWDSPRGETTYGAQTIETALEGRTEFYGDRCAGASTSAERAPGGREAAGRLHPGEQDQGPSHPLG